MDGVDPVVVVTTMPLSSTARSDLSELLGPDYVVVDIKRAPTTADIVLTTVVSGQSIGVLRGLFPQARILLTEIQDAERGIRYAGPLTRAWETGPDGYFIAHDLEALSPIVQSQARLQLEARSGSGPGDANILGSPAGAAPGAPHPEPPEVDGENAGVVAWVSSTAGHPPRGEPLDLRPLDDAVSAILQTAEPRESPLWSTLVAECAIHLVRERRATVLVDVSDVPARALAELRLHLSVDGTRQVTWPTDAS